MQRCNAISSTIIKLQGLYKAGNTLSIGSSDNEFMTTILTSLFYVIIFSFKYLAIKKGWWANRESVIIKKNSLHNLIYAEVEEAFVPSALLPRPTTSEEEVAHFLRPLPLRCVSRFFFRSTTPLPSGEGRLCELITVWCMAQWRHWSRGCLGQEQITQIDRVIYMYTNKGESLRECRSRRKILPDSSRSIAYSIVPANYMKSTLKLIRYILDFWYTI